MKFRKLISSALSKLITKRGLVLMYHRIADIDIDPWNLAVSPENFNQQLKVLSGKFNVVPASKVAEQLKEKNIVSKSIGITFDDGYRDNYFVAKPLLEKYNLPATFYIPSWYVGKKEQFWWDELIDIILNKENLPPVLNFKIGNEILNYSLSEESNLSEIHRQKHKKWKTKDKPPTKRCELYLKLWNLLKPLTLNEIVITMHDLQTWADYKTGVLNEHDLPMDKNHIEQLIKNENFELGIHTDKHTALGYQPYHIQEEEIIRNRNYLQETIKTSINTLSYPYGSYNDETIKIAKSLNLSAAFTTKGRAFTKRTDLYQIGRFCVKNWNGREFSQQLQKWLNKI